MARMRKGFLLRARGLVYRLCRFRPVMVSVLKITQVNFDKVYLGNVDMALHEDETAIYWPATGIGSAGARLARAARGPGSHLWPAARRQDRIDPPLLQGQARCLLRCYAGTRAYQIRTFLRAAAERLGQS